MWKETRAWRGVLLLFLLRFCCCCTTKRIMSPKARLVRDGHGPFTSARSRSTTSLAGTPEASFPTLCFLQKLMESENVVRHAEHKPPCAYGVLQIVGH